MLSCFSTRDQRLAADMEVSNVSDDEYIDMEISLSPSNLVGSPVKQCRGFEFPVASTAQGRLETIEFPADELFYKGKLLPLHLPPRLQMVERLRSPKIRRSSHGPDQEFIYEDGDGFQEEDMFSLPTVLIMPSASHGMSTSTWSISSRNISPSESNRVSCEVNHVEDNYSFEWSNEHRGLIHCDKKKQFLSGSSCSESSSFYSALWSKPLNQIKQSLICQKIISSKAFIRSFFSKINSRGGGGGHSQGGRSIRDPCNTGAENLQVLGGSEKLTMRAPSEQNDNQGHDCNYRNLSLSIVKRIHRELAESGAANIYRKSFSAVTQQHSVATTASSNSFSLSSSSSSSSSSSFRLNNNVMHELQLLKQSSDASLGIEKSIEGAIAHCKRSHKLLPSQKEQ
ncbi:hypothetical protein SAY86_014596 [Trapa natans]|uniref:Membrane-associated kinase regulator 4 n=1 Tax=Trapa natans TaxID=22666 RepID=A0AAN7KHA6_TRANT|nr:hypothetical protein SAY86_014596 [Trapa natans]